MEVTATEINRQAQHFHDVSGIGLAGIGDKPKVVAGLRAVLRNLGFTIVEDEQPIFEGGYPPRFAIGDKVKIIRDKHPLQRDDTFVVTEVVADPTPGTGKSNSAWRICPFYYRGDSYGAGVWDVYLEMVEKGPN